MPQPKVTCACGKQYAWKPELAGKRAKCKCGSVVAFPATPPIEEEAPEGFDDMGEIPMAPPPPPPPMAGAGVGGGPGAAPAYAPPPPPGAGTRGTIARGSMPRGGGRVPKTGGGSGFTFSGKAVWNMIWGIGIIAFGIFLFVTYAEKEAAGESVRIRGRRSGIIWLIYNTLGKWGLLGLFTLVGLGLILFAVMVMMGKKEYGEDE